jgi:hypothetical protein
MGTNPTRTANPQGLKMARKCSLKTAKTIGKEAADVIDKLMLSTFHHDVEREHECISHQSKTCTADLS